MPSLNNFETRIEVKVEKMYKIQVSTLIIHLSTPLEIKKKGKGRIEEGEYKMMKKGEEREREREQGV